MSVSFFLLLQIVSNALSEESRLNGNYSTSIFEGIFAQFENHIKVIHFENSSMDNITEIISHYNIILINYDVVFHKINLIRENRPYLHLFLINNSILKGLKITRKSFLYVDIIFFIIIGETTIKKKKLCFRPYFHQVSAVFIYDRFHSRYWICNYFCGNNCTKKNKVNHQDGTIPLFANIVKKYSNFRGHTFKIGYTETVPLIYTK